MILGTDWMKHFSPITFDFEAFNIRMFQEGKEVTLQGSVKNPTIKLVRGEDMAKFRTDQQRSHSRFRLSSMEASEQVSSLDGVS